MLVPRRFQRWSLSLAFILLVLCLSALFTFQHASNYGSSVYRDGLQTQDATELQQAPILDDCPAEIESLRRLELDLTDTIVYSRRCIKPERSPEIDRGAVAKLNGPLITQRAAINITSCRHIQLPPCEPLSLNVSEPYPVEMYPHFVFGVSTTYERLNRSLDGFVHWLSGTRARLVAIVVDAEPMSGVVKDLSAIEKRYSDHSVELVALKPHNKTLTVAQNHFAVLADLLDAATPQTSWLGIVDDDTFFPSLYNLDQELKQHDYTTPVWLGAPSEDSDLIKQWGIMAFGGAGVFISVPLARELVPHIPACLVEAALPTGDSILRDCISKHTTVRLTIIPGLYQHDLYGDAAGFYESGVLPLSVHHWRSWYHEPIPKMASITKLCGDCFLQRFQFDGDTLLANGFSVTQYRRGLGGYDLTQMEGTWSLSAHEFDSRLGSLRPALSDEDKKSYRLRDVVRGPNGQLRQIYVYTKPFLSEAMDEVLELVWDPADDASL